MSDNKKIYLAVESGRNDQVMELLRYIAEASLRWYHGSVILSNSNGSLTPEEASDIAARDIVVTERDGSLYMGEMKFHEFTLLKQP